MVPLWVESTSVDSAVPVFSSPGVHSPSSVEVVPHSSWGGVSSAGTVSEEMRTSLVTVVVVVVLVVKSTIL